MNKIHSEWSYWYSLGFCLILSALLVFLMPAEKTLGNGIRLIYFHGAWVWTGIILFGLAGLAGLAAVLLKQIRLHLWSAALGRAALCFWLTYLPMSLLVMQLNWNGLFFDEPRWKIPFTFGVVGLLIQAGLFLIHIPWLTSITNFGFGAALLYNLNKIQSVLHPQSPIQQSGSLKIQILFGILVIITLASGGFLSRLWLGWANCREKEVLQ
jgi:hypothetical protein